MSRIFVATPCGHLDPRHADCIDALRIEAGERGTAEIITYREYGISGICRSRNRAVSEFLKSTATHLFFIDDDISFQPQDVFTMASSGLDLVCGLYPKKYIDWGRVWKAAMYDGVGYDKLAEYASPLCFEPLPGRPKILTADDKTHFVEVKRAATGFMCISRQCIEAMIEGYTRPYQADYTGKPEKHYALFIEEVRKEDGIPRYLSEDWLFCDDWRALGGSVYAYLECQLQHAGTHYFTGSLAREVTL